MKDAVAPWNNPRLGNGQLFLMFWKAALLSCCSESSGSLMENPTEILLLLHFVRTVNRNWSPRLKAFGRQNNVGKGSRQNGSVTSGKGLAPRVHAGCRRGRSGRYPGKGGCVPCASWCVARGACPRSSATCVSAPAAKHQLGTVTNKRNLTG